MAIPVVAHRSAFRGARAPVASAAVPAVKGPVGATSSTTAADQAKALRAPDPAAATTAAAAYDPNKSMYAGGAPIPGMGAGPGAAPAAAPDENATWSGLPRDVQTQVKGAYGSGGFDAVKQIPGWYDLPSDVRTQILVGART